MTLAVTALAAMLLSQSGGKLQTTDLVKGKGASASKGDVVTVLYTGSLQDGKVFDSTEGKPPFAFELGAGVVIKGWDEGIRGMKVGGKRKLVIPPHMGYGASGSGEVIPPNATLTFEVELLRVDKKGKTQQIEVTEIAGGEGVPAKAGDKVRVHYRGTLLNGLPFDNSYDRNQPFELTLGETKVIKGFEQGVTGMKVGGKRKVVIPYELAYGDRQRNEVIGPKSTLIFELELVEIVRA
ncbi:MAG TPA: FKBP-type peptidyl-prolyl cis-trans isomerase [Fimbriimonadaceae bacterium]|nr:FKBP-type peptidyl-prolyl cis-trans isomerase [Fimbriimonadaceae bacterium]